MKYFIGLDVSKGYVDVSIVNDAGSFFNGSQCYNDNNAGHTLLLNVIGSLPEPESIDIAMESTGGFERNWLKTFRGYERIAKCTCKTYLLNPLCIRRFSQLALHQSTTDRSAAKQIALYLKAGLPRTRFSEKERIDDGVRALYRTILNITDRKSQIANEIQSMLPTVQAELVQYARNGLSTWLLDVLAHYPTALKLGRARRETLARIPHVTQERAKKIIACAKKTVSSNTDEFSEMALQSLVEDHQYASKKITKMREQLEKLLSKNVLVERLCTIPGIGKWTAIGLLVEIGDFTRFAKGEQLVAYAGLDPVYHQSGDGLKKGKISRRGNRQIRSLLFLPAQTAALHNPVIKTFYQRLRANGKGHYLATVASMRKLLNISFALLVSGKDFQPDYEAKRQKTKTVASKPNESLGKVQKTESLDAPISRREAARRKKLIEKKDLCLDTRSTPQCKVEHKSHAHYLKEVSLCNR